jgi:hypothetical protein
VEDPTGTTHGTEELGLCGACALMGMLARLAPKGPRHMIMLTCLASAEVGGAGAIWRRGRGIYADPYVGFSSPGVLNLALRVLN